MYISQTSQIVNNNRQKLSSFHLEHDFVVITVIIAMQQLLEFVFEEKRPGRDQMYQ